jgi:hypothetical protein
VVPPSNNRKLAPYMLRLELHIMFQEQVAGALQVVGRIIYCCNILIVKPEEWFPCGSTQQFQGLLFFPMYPARNNTKIITQSQYI